MHLVFILSAIHTMTACTFGNWQICGPQTPPANCDREAYMRLTQPGPYGTHWVKEGMTVEQRRVDSWACGAVRPEIMEHAERAADHVIFDKKMEQLEKKPDDPNDISAYLRLRAVWAKCMESKGYRYEK